LYDAAPSHKYISFVCCGRNQPVSCWSSQPSALNVNKAFVIAARLGQSVSRLGAIVKTLHQSFIWLVIVHYSVLKFCPLLTCVVFIQFMKYGQSQHFRGWFERKLSNMKVGYEGMAKVGIISML